MTLLRTSVADQEQELDPDPGGPKTCISGGSGSATLLRTDPDSHIRTTFLRIRIRLRIRIMLFSTGAIKIPKKILLLVSEGTI